MSVYTWGFGKYGQLGNGQTASAETPQLLKLPRHSLPQQISCGAHFTIALCKSTNKDGSPITKLFSCGWGKYGRLGTGSEEDHSLPTEVRFGEAPSEIFHISAGFWHACCISSDGQLFAWGYNKSHGVLGLPSDSASPQTPFIPTPTRIPLSVGVKLKFVSCGYNYSYAVGEDGSCWSWGSGAHGVLGLGDTNDHPQPTQVNVPNGDAITRVSCGYSHAAVVTNTGTIMTVGQGADGALGLGKADMTNKTKLQVVIGLDSINIISVSCSLGERHGHTLACTSSGEVYSWGDGYKGKLGLGDQESRYLPTRINPGVFQGEAVIDVVCGGIHSAAVSRKGSVFTWGCGSDGRLGHPEAKGHRYLFRSDVPRKVEGVADNVLNVDCSYYHTAVLTSAS